VVDDAGEPVGARVGTEPDAEADLHSHLDDATEAALGRLAR
jgi:hypothetical protein